LGSGIVRRNPAVVNTFRIDATPLCNNGFNQMCTCYESGSRVS
jgi:hypothetical protein